MKSIMEEASTIAKAIENGWQRAGKPQEFTVRILEHPERNFLGLTTKPARISLFFEGALKTTTPLPKKESSIRETSQRTSMTQYSTERSSHKPAHEGLRPTHRSRPLRQTTHTQGQVIAPVNRQWQEQAVAHAQQWLTDCLAAMGISAPIEHVVQGETLELHVGSALVQDKEKERLLCKSLAHITFEALRNKTKLDLRSLRITIFVKKPGN